MLWEIDALNLDGDLGDDKIVCENCGWSWEIKYGGDDLYICHQCGYDNTPKYN
jgi:hypothetical protein